MRDDTLKLPRPTVYLGLSQACSLIGGNMGSLTIAWWAAKHGGIADLSLSTGSYVLFSLVLGPLLSPLGDRHSRIKIFGYGLVGSGIYYFLWGIGLLGLGYSRSVLLLLSLTNAFTMTIVGPIRMAIFLDAKGGCDARRVISFQRTLDNVGRSLGPVLAGGVGAYFGFVVAYLVQLSFFAAAVIFYLLAGRGFCSALQPENHAQRINGWVNEIFLGFQLRSRGTGPRVLTLMLVLYSAVVASCLAVVLPQIILDNGQESTRLGLISSVSFVGGLLTGVAMLSPHFPSGARWVTSSMALTAISIFALQLPLSSFATLVAAFLIGVCTEIYTQRVGFRIVLSYPANVRARLAASGQFIATASISLWCWLIVPLHAQLGLAGTVMVLTTLILIATLLSLHPIIASFLKCPDHELGHFWGRHGGLIAADEPA